MSETRTVTLEELATVLAAVKGAKPLGVSTFTDARARKRDCHLGTVMKLNRLSVFAGASYASSVERARLRQGMPEAAPFEVKEAAWFEPVPGSPALRRHRETKAVYLAVHVLAAQRPTYLYQRTAGFWSPVEKAVVAPFLPADQTEQTAERQGLDRPVIFRTFKLESLVSVRLDRVTYRVRRGGGVVSPVIQPARYVSPLAAPISEALAVAPEALTSQALRAALRSKLGPPSSDPMDEGLHPHDQGDHGDHERD